MMEKRIFALLLSMALLANMSLPGTVAAELNEPANSTAQELICGFAEEHTHEDTCRGAEPVCGLEVTEGHSHSEACAESKQTCELAETEGHTHGDACKQSTLTCVVMDETHVHETGCYTESVTCGQNEAAAHIHTQEGCYSLTYTCGLEEAAAHQHDTSCYEWTCEKTEHTHVDACWVTVCAECRQQTGHGEDCSYGVQPVEEPFTEAEFIPFAGTFKESEVILYRNLGATEGTKYTAEKVGSFMVVEQMTDASGNLWYKLDFDNDLIDSFGNVYVLAESVTKTTVEPAVPSATVSGAPDGFELEIKNAEIDLNEFGIENEEDFIAALDISLEKDGLVWQGNDEQESVAVSVDMTQYDIADGTVVRVHHQHDGEITTIEPLIIINGKLTFATDGFSVFVVEKAHETTPLEPIEGTTITMTVGEEKTFYWTEGDTVTTYNSAHFWVVDDPEGYIYPQVHSMGAKTHFGYHWYEQHQAPWITIKANKATPEGEPITLTMKYGQTKSEEFTLIVVNPCQIFSASFPCGYGMEVS